MQDADYSKTSELDADQWDAEFTATKVRVPLLCVQQIGRGNRELNSVVVTERLIARMGDL